MVNKALVWLCDCDSVTFGDTGVEILKEKGKEVVGLEAFRHAEVCSPNLGK